MPRSRQTVSYKTANSRSQSIMPSETAHRHWKDGLPIKVSSFLSFRTTKLPFCFHSMAHVLRFSVDTNSCVLPTRLHPTTHPALRRCTRFSSLPTLLTAALCPVVSASVSWWNPILMTGTITTLLLAPSSTNSFLRYRCSLHPRTLYPSSSGTLAVLSTTSFVLSLLMGLQLRGL